MVRSAVTGHMPFLNTSSPFITNSNIHSCVIPAFMSMLSISMFIISMSSISMFSISMLSIPVCNSISMFRVEHRLYGWVSGFGILGLRNCGNFSMCVCLSSCVNFMRELREFREFHAWICVNFSVLVSYLLLIISNHIATRRPTHTGVGIALALFLFEEGSQPTPSVFHLFVFFLVIFGVSAWFCRISKKCP